MAGETGMKQNDRMLAGIEPESVMHFFEEISAIPRGSFQEKAVSDYCVAFARERSLEVYQDKLYNVIIKKPASKGYEQHPAVILQGHLDMVCEKEPAIEHNFAQDGLKLKAEDGFISAEGTTLGGDDGIAIAYALAVLDAQDIPHPPLEAVFTVCEETGMEGAAGIDMSVLQGRLLLNLDSEEEGCILTSCAGGCRVNCTEQLPVEKLSKDMQVYRITIDGLAGGHSGCEIHKGRANANVLMARLLRIFLQSELSFQMISMEGGSKDNAIPVACTARIAVSAKDSERFAAFVQSFEKTVQKEFAYADNGITVTCAPWDIPVTEALTQEATGKITALMSALPNGIQAMSAELAGMVETSLNFGIAKIEQGSIMLKYLLRSSKQSAMQDLAQRMILIGSMLGVNTKVESSYPAWEYRQDSRLRSIMTEVYRKLYNAEPKVESIHAGVECGILVSKSPELDCVSFGPDILDIHTPRERMDIASVQRTYAFLLEILKAL